MKFLVLGKQGLFQTPFKIVLLNMPNIDVFLAIFESVDEHNFLKLKPIRVEVAEI